MRKIMKKILASTLLLVFIILGVLYAKHRYFDPRNRLNNANEEVKRLIDKDEIREGDIIFQTSLSRQSGAIQLATHSQYSHCGIIYKTGNSYFVFEAVQPVKLTPLNKWIAKGKDGHFVIKRLKYSANILTPAAIKKLKDEGQIFKGKNYDVYFDWSDDKIYCSELIWKVYDRALGIQIGKLQKLKDFDLSNPTVKQIMYQRYGNKVPLDETVISPVSIFNSELLQTVVSN
jgi:uncharacterized protein YycO